MTIVDRRLDVGRRHRLAFDNAHALLQLKKDRRQPGPFGLLNEGVDVPTLRDAVRDGEKPLLEEKPIYGRLNNGRLALSLPSCVPCAGLLAFDLRPKFLAVEPLKKG